jgi:hypothetical protein
MSIVKLLFYLLGAIFFVVVILAMFIIVYKVWYTTSTIKKTLMGGQIEELINQLKQGIRPTLMSLGLAQ